MTSPHCVVKNVDPGCSSHLLDELLSNWVVSLFNLSKEKTLDFTQNTWRRSAGLSKHATTEELSQHEDHSSYICRDTFLECCNQVKDLQKIFY